MLFVFCTNTILKRLKDPPDNGCNNKNWKPHSGTSSSQPIDLKNAPDGLNKINMSELADWVSGKVSARPTVAQPTTKAQTTTTVPPTYGTIQLG